MIACQVKEIKQFMNTLLNSEAFDTFRLEEARITTFNTYEIDGHVVPEFYDGLEDRPETLPEFTSWHEIRPIFLQLIKGKRTPVSFQFTLHASKDYTNKLITQHEIPVSPDAVRCLLVNIRFEHGALKLITGTAFTTFIPDKTLEKLWDTTFKKSLASLHIDFEEL